MALSPDEIRRQLADLKREREQPARKERPKRVEQRSRPDSRTLPHSIEAEQGVLGSMIISPSDVIGECVEKITEEYFYSPAHQTIYTVLVELWNAGGAIDLITFTQVLRDRNVLETVGGAAFVTSLFTGVPSAANLVWYLEILRDKYLLRQVIAAGTDAVRSAFERQDEVDSMIDEIEQRFIGLGDDRFKASVVIPIKKAAMMAMDDIQEAFERKGAVRGIPTGFIELDRLTGGLQLSEMAVIAARPSMGKTSLCMNIADHAAVEAGIPVAVFSLEMTLSQLVQRMIASRARVNLQRIREGLMSERDFPAISAAVSRISESKLYIDDTPSLAVLELRAKARRMKAKYDVQLVIVDYLQLLRSGTKRGQENRQIEVSEISAGLKTLAKELSVAVLVVAQLNRQPEARQRGRPRLSDLRESGSIEQDADTVGLLVRPEVYEEDEDARREMAGEALLIIAKQRNGPIGEIPLIFQKEFTRFCDHARPFPESLI